ncbi:hypothetical protein Trydic_g9553 [Trypoxylus dichotomus]
MKFQPRSAVLAEIKKTRRKELRASFTRESSVTELTVLEFLSIACLYQLNMRYILVYMELITKHGAIIVTVFYFLLTGILGMPLFMLFTFMSNYSKRSYFTFWKCVPLFEGLGYGLAVLRMATEIDNITIASFSLLLLFQFSSGSMWEKSVACKDNVTYCSKMFSTENVTMTCNESSSSVVTSVENYIDGIRRKYSTIAGISVLNVNWLIITGILWIVILLSSVYGLGYVKRVTVCLQLICGSVMLFICIVCVSYTSWSTITTVELVDWIKAKSIFQFDFWIDLILHAAEVNILANMIWLGTLKPKNLHPKYAAIIVTILKLTAYILFVCLTACLVKETVTHYRILDSRCLKIDYYLFTYGYTPERYWIASWKSTPILAVLCFILVVHNQYSNEKCTSEPNILITIHVVVSFGLFPVILIFMTTCCNHVKVGTLSNLARPAPEWGPHDVKLKIEKAQFFPQRDIRYRKTQVTCRHNCIKDTNPEFVKLSLLHRSRLKTLETERNLS